MLIEFNVENFLSFKDNVTLSMEKGKYLKKYANTHLINKCNYSLLKNVNIFGANGSGKSNLLAALQVLRDMVMRPTSAIEDELPYMPFGLDDKSNDLPTIFSIKIIINNQVYKYSIEFNNLAFLLEELYLVDSNDNEIIYFKRTHDGKNEILPEKFLDFRKSVRNNKLLLFEGQNRNDKHSIAVYKWFSSNLVFEPSGKQLFDTIKNNEALKLLFIKLLNLSDINIIDIEVIKKVEAISDRMKNLMQNLSEKDSSAIPKKITRLDVYSIYKKFDKLGNYIGTEKIPFEIESDGTKKMMLLALTLLDSLDKDRVIILDEFDDSFHLSLTKALLKLINSNSNSNQFIFTTHNLNILDFEMRIDQIYFMEKNFMGKTDLFSLFDFNDVNGLARNDISFVKRYLNGQFGALPDIDIDAMTELFEGCK